MVLYIVGLGLGDEKVSDLFEKAMCTVSGVWNMIYWNNLSHTSFFTMYNKGHYCPWFRGSKIMLENILGGLYKYTASE